MNLVVYTFAVIGAVWVASFVFASVTLWLDARDQARLQRSAPKGASGRDLRIWMDKMGYDE